MTPNFSIVVCVYICFNTIFTRHNEKWPCFFIVVGQIWFFCDFTTSEKPVSSETPPPVAENYSWRSRGRFFLLYIYIYKVLHKACAVGERKRLTCYFSVETNVPTALRSASERRASVSRQTQRPGSVLSRCVSLTSGRPRRWSWKTTLCR